MVDVEIYKAREKPCRNLAVSASNSGVRWLYEDMARHDRRLIDRGDYAADVRVAPLGRDD